MAPEGEIRIEITEANLKHNHFYLRPHVHKFPDDVIGGSNKSKLARRVLKLDWGGPAPAETDIDGEDKKFFRARGWVGAFFKLNGAQPGDFVVVVSISSEIEEGCISHWRQAHDRSASTGGPPFAHYVFSGEALYDRTWADGMDPLKDGQRLPRAAVRTRRARLMFPSRTGFPSGDHLVGSFKLLDSMLQQELETIFDDIILNRLG